MLEALNVSYQPLIDRFVAGEAVPDDSVSLAWRNSTQLLLWDIPLYKQLLNTVRDVNRTLPAGRKIRVLASDPPIDWSSIRTGADFPKIYGYRDWQAVAVLRSEVLHRGQKALVIIGGTHIYKQSPRLDTARDTIREGIGESLERTNPGDVYSVTSVVGDDPIAEKLDGIRPFTLVPVSSEKLSGLDGSVLFGKNVTLFKSVNGKRVPVKLTTDMLPALSDAVDAVLYLGKYGNTIEPDFTAYRNDAAYLAETRRRIRILSEVYGVDIWSESLDNALR
jgi:hypothetical protein